MASINGITLKALKVYNGMEGPTYYGNLYICISDPRKSLNGRRIQMGRLSITFIWLPDFLNRNLEICFKIMIKLTTILASK